MGVGIHIKRNRVVVTGYNLSKCSGWLPNVLRVFDTKVKRYDKDKTYSYLLDNGDIILPRTTEIQPIVHRIRSQNLELDGIFNENNEDLIEYYNFSKPINLRDGFKPKDRFQEESIRFLTGHLPDNMHYRLLSLPTGDGKTFCALSAMCHYGRKTLIVANQLSSQWVREVLDKTDCHYSKIFEISGIDSVEKLMSKSVRPNTYDIYIASLQTLMNACEAGIYENMCIKLGIGLKIIDEVHLATYTNIYVDMMAAIQETLYLSATPSRSDPNEDYCLKKAFKELPQYGYEVRDFKEKYLTSIYVMFDTKPKYYQVQKCNSWYGFKTAIYAEQIFSPPAHEIIFDILSWAINTTLPNISEDEKIVIIFELKEHVILAQKVFSSMYPDITIGDYTSNVDKSVKNDSLRNKLILTTDKSFGTGADMNGKLRVLINTITYSSKVTAQQLPGRLRNIPGKRVYYIDLVNMGYKRCYDHYLKRSKIIDSYSLSSKKLTYGKDI